MAWQNMCRRTHETHDFYWHRKKPTENILRVKWFFRCQSIITLTEEYELLRKWLIFYVNVSLINFYTWHGGVFTWPSSSSILIRGVQDNHLYPCQMGFTNLIANKWSHKVNEINYGQLGYYTYIGKYLQHWEHVLYLYYFLSHRTFFSQIENYGTFEK